MLLFLLLAPGIDFLAASLWASWFSHATVACFLGLLALPAERASWGMLGAAALSFLVTDFAAHGFFGGGLLFAIPMALLLLRLKRMLAHGALWLILLGYCGFFAYEWLVCGAQVTMLKITFNLLLGYITLLGLRGNRASPLRAGGTRKVWTPSRRDAS